MEWTIYIKSEEKSYKALKIIQGANHDITIIPKNAVYFSKEIIRGLRIGDQIQLEYKDLGDKIIDHYSAHATSGQRHIKINPTAPASEPSMGMKFKKIESVIPLGSMVAVANEGSQKEPGSGQWFGFNLPQDVNYIIMDLFAIPKKFNVKFNYNLNIQNKKDTKECIDMKDIEMKTCRIIVHTRCTNHELTDISHNVFFQHIEGKTAIISRVERGRILAQVVDLKIDKI